MYEEKDIKYKKIKKNNKFNKKKMIIKPSKKLSNNKNKLFNGINWKVILCRLAILLIIMILIMFIATRISNQDSHKNKIINNNLDYIIENSLNYYNKDSVKNIGDAKTLTLEEMISEKIINPIKDKNDNECDIKNSYTVFIKIKDIDYRLKIYLKCDNEDIILEKDLVCNNTCYVKK